MRQESGKDKYGINMGKWCRSHEEELAALTERAGEDVSALRDVLELHETRLGFLQHERLVHLIVLVMTVFGELFVVGLVLCLPDTFPVSLIVMYGLVILLAFYVKHYFFLENTVQHWYHLDDELRHTIQKMPSKGGTPAGSGR